MHHAGYFIFCSVMILCYVISRTNAYQKNKSEKERQAFWNREREANSTRKKDISSLDYINVDIESFPVKNLEAIDSSLYDELKELSAKKIINLSQYTNTDLKLMYGVANLNLLTQYDENYTRLIVLLNKIGKALYDYPEDVKAFLEYSVSIGSDIRQTYEMLANIYMDKKDEKAFDRLLESAEKLSSLSKSTIITNLHNIKSQTK